MAHIPFSLQTDKGLIKGYLNPMDKIFPPTWFHVMVGKKYCGQLMKNPQLGWWLPDSIYSKYAQKLGDIVEAWYE